MITFHTGPTLGHEADAGLNPGAWTVATGSSPGYMATVALPGNTDASQVKPIIHAGAPLTIAFDLAPVGW